MTLAFETTDTCKELMAQIAKAATNGEIEQFTNLQSQYVASKAEYEKQHREAERKAIEAKATERAEISKAHLSEVAKALKESFVVSLNDIATIEKLLKVWPSVVTDASKVEAHAIRFNVADEQSNIARLALVPKGTSVARSGAAKARGKTSDEYGKSLGQIFDEYATAAEKAEHDALTSEQYSKKWQLKLIVKRRAIAEGKIKPVK